MQPDEFNAKALKAIELNDKLNRVHAEGKIDDGKYQSGKRMIDEHVSRLKSANREFINQKIAVFMGIEADLNAQKAAGQVDDVKFNSMLLTVMQEKAKLESERGDIGRFSSDEYLEYLRVQTGLKPGDAPAVVPEAKPVEAVSIAPAEPKVVEPAEVKVVKPLGVKDAAATVSVPRAAAVSGVRYPPEWAKKVGYGLAALIALSSLGVAFFGGLVYLAGILFACAVLSLGLSVVFMYAAAKGLRLEGASMARAFTAVMMMALVGVSAKVLVIVIFFLLFGPPLTGEVPLAPMVLAFFILITEYKELFLVIALAICVYSVSKVYKTPMQKAAPVVIVFLVVWAVFGYLLYVSSDSLGLGAISGWLGPVIPFLSILRRSF